MEEVVRKSPFETRIHEIDLIRGLLMCLVILDHVFNLLISFNQGWAHVSTGENIEPFFTIYKVAHWYWTNPVRTVVRWICLGSFCFVSGISSAFSRNNFKRAIEMICLWALIFVFSNLLEGIRSYYDLDIGVRTLRVDFNIIGVLAWSTLVYSLVQEKDLKWLIIIAAIALVIHPICVVLSNTAWGQETYAPFLWKPSAEIADQADYMPLFPYLSFFFGGVILSRYTYSVEKKSYFKKYNWERPFCFVGRHSLIIYVTHFVALILLFLFVGVFIK